MRRFALVAAALVTAACGAPQVDVREQSLTFASPLGMDSVLARASAELVQLGFTIGGRQDNLVFTVPKAMPAEAAGRTVSDSGEQLWFVHVLAADRLFRGGSNTTLRAYLMPRTGNLTPGNIVQEQAQPVTSARPEAFRELRRIADRLQAAAFR